jgi:phage shock protein PspC (stress-responsive transcriptional regulator)
MAEEKKSKAKDNDKAEPAPRRLLRSSKDRWLWGVAGGLAEYLRVDPTLVRLGFAVAAIFGGFGVIAYLVMAVVVPQDDGTGHPRTDRRPPTPAIILLAIAVLIALPGRFWGWDHGWHGHWLGWFGPLWIIFLIVIAVVAVRTLRGRPPRWLRARGAESSTDERDGETADTETGDTDVRGGEAPRWVRAIAMVLLAAAAIGAALALGTVAAWSTATGHGSVVAGLVIALGVAIAGTAFIGEARRIGAWLLGAALVLALPAGATAAADIHFNGGIGERTYHPTTVADIPAGGYDFGVGEMQVDLRDLPWANGQTIAVKSNLGVGQMIVSVPSSVCVHANATGKAGELLVRGDQSDGIDPEIDQGQPRSQAPRLDLDAEIQLGQLIVTDQDPEAITEHGFDYDHNRLSKESQRQVCGL